MHQLSSLADTYEHILRKREPNFLRLYLSHRVAQVCFCLDRYVRTTWSQSPTRGGRGDGLGEPCQSFLANGLEEALGGAIKLLRYNDTRIGVRSTCLVLDPADRLAGFAGVALADGGAVEFLPGLRVVGKAELGREPGRLSLEQATENGRPGALGRVVDTLVLVAGDDPVLENHAELVRMLVRRYRPRVITCVNRASLAAIRAGARSMLREIVPDIVVFDESFVDHAVPFGAFTARESLFACWNRAGKATFHSTTFQPNTISALHFMRCLATADSEFYGRYSELFLKTSTDLSLRAKWFRRHYNPALFRLIRATGFYSDDVQAAGSFVFVNGRPIFDAVSGVACSFRGHNPAAYPMEMRALDPASGPGAGGPRALSAGFDRGFESELGRRLESLTGLDCFLPAVSGATAVENGLKVALVAQFPRRHVLALRAGFGGKTLLALTGTANAAYKERIGPLYADVHYVDPFAPDAEARIHELLETHPVAVVQLELIQAVGGVRKVPENVVRLLDAGRRRWGYLLMVDEVQTGMYRTGPFILSPTLGLAPDILLLGKATSDMIFPFALTLYSAAVRAKLERSSSSLLESIERRYGYEQGYKTVINVLRLAEERSVGTEVGRAGALYAELLGAGLATCKIVRDVRVFGLLIGIELDMERWPHRWLRKHLSSLYLLSMLRHVDFPVLAGLCQYEPNVLKITPPLSVSPDEVRRSCATIIDVLGRPLHQVVAAALRSMMHSSSIGRRNHEHANDAALELVAR
jgi:acetylornithine/succinyldiaminopimelate/putrescine aminotransferase